MSQTGGSQSSLPTVLSLADILLLSVDELRTELESRKIPYTGLTKPDLQLALIQAAVPKEKQTGKEKTDEVFAEPPEHLSSLNVSDDSGSQTHGADKDFPAEMRFKLKELEMEAEARKYKGKLDHEAVLADAAARVEAAKAEAAARAEAAKAEAAARLEKEKLELQTADQERQRAYELAMKQLEIDAANAAAAAAQTAAASSFNSPAGHSSVLPTSPPFRVDTAVKLVPKFDEKDIESFLIGFEKVAELNNFPRDKYAAILQAHLTGKALKVFTELSTDDCKDYDTLKAALLSAYAVVSEVYRRRFRGLTKNQSDIFSEFAFKLTTQFRRWAESEKAYDDIQKLRELILMEQFIETLDSELRVWLIDQEPKGLSDAAKLADQYVAVRRASRAKNSQPQSWSKSPHNANGGRRSPPIHRVPRESDQTPTVSSDSHARPSSGESTNTRKSSKVICFFCKKPGHVTSVCRKRLAQAQSGGKPATGESSVGLVSTLAKTATPSDQAHLDLESHKDSPDPGYRSHCLKATLLRPNMAPKTVRALRDTGALQSLLARQAVVDGDYVDTGEVRLIRGITGEVQSVPLVQVSLNCKLCNGNFLVGLVDRLPTGIDALIGNDLCCAADPVDTCVVTRSQAAKQRAAESTQANALPTTPVIAATPTVSAPVTTSKMDDDTNATSEFELLFDDGTESPPQMPVDRQELIRLQQSDHSLAALFSSVIPESEQTADKTSYFLKNGVLMRTFRDKLAPSDAGIHQVVVPFCLRSKLLYLAHDIPAAGHLGVAKTTERLQRHFFWPTICKDVKEYCRTCPVCQKLGKGAKPAVAPLHSLPLVTEPFSEIAMDIIGPLPPCRNSGNRFILTVLDLCTHYPEAIPLQHHTAQDVARALISVFSHFGFPSRILSDQGTDFLSELMQVFLHEFGISQLNTSPYHPQTNGACERLNGTLKSMLRSLSDQFPDSWDQAIPWVLFAYREVPVETLGCSPQDIDIRVIQSFIEF